MFLNITNRLSFIIFFHISQIVLLCFWKLLWRLGKFFYRRSVSSFLLSFIPFASFFLPFTTFCIICHKPFLGGHPFYSIFHYKQKKDEPKFIKIYLFIKLYFWRIFVHLFIMPFFVLKGTANWFYCFYFSTKCWLTHGLEVIFGYIKGDIHIPFMTYYTVCLFYYFLLILSTFFYLVIPYLL